MGSEHYKPQEIATWLMYSTKMKECWEYFTERYDMCRKAEPNVSHSTLVELEHYCVAQNKEFTLVSQNIDNLHRRAGSTNPLESKCNGEQCPPIFLVQHI
jgi:NAD-dependent deacetylase